MSPRLPRQPALAGLCRYLCSAPPALCPPRVLCGCLSSLATATHAPCCRYHWKKLVQPVLDAKVPFLNTLG